MRLALLLLAVVCTACGQLGLYRDEVDVRDSFAPGARQHPDVVGGVYFGDGVQASWRTRNATILVISGGNHVSALDASAGQLMHERYWAQVVALPPPPLGGVCLDWDADGVCDAVVAVRERPADAEVALSVWSGVDGAVLWTHALPALPSAPVQLAPGDGAANVTCCVAAQCWTLGSGGGFVPSANAAPSAAKPSAPTAPSPDDGVVWHGDAEYRVRNGSVLEPAPATAVPFWRLDGALGSVSGWRATAGEGRVEPRWRFGADLRICAAERMSAEHGVWSPATEVGGTGQIAKKFLRQQLLCVSRACTVYVLDAATGALHTSFAVDACDAPLALQVFEHRFVLVFRNRAQFATVVLTGVLYEGGAHGPNAVRVTSSARNLVAAPYALDAASLTVMRSRLGLVSPLLVFATHDHRVVALPFHASQPAVVLSHARRFVGPPIRRMRCVPLRLESQMLLQVESATGDTWNVTVAPDGTFDTFSLHDARKKAALLAVMGALVVAVLVTSRVRRALPLRQRWYF